MNAKSIEDVKFGLAFNKHVHSSVFFLQVARMAKNDVSPLTVSWALKSGRVLFASLNTIKGLRARCSPPLEENPAAFRKALTQKLPDGLPSWREQYLNITKDPAGSCEDMDFDECYSWGISFYHLTPIRDKVYLLDLYTRLMHVGYKVMDFVSLLGLQNKGFMSCECQTYLHRAFCVHCCADAVRKGIITGFPFNPATLIGRGPGAVTKEAGKPGTKRTAAGALKSTD